MFRIGTPVIVFFLLERYVYIGSILQMMNISAVLSQFLGSLRIRTGELSFYDSISQNFFFVSNRKIIQITRLRLTRMWRAVYVIHNSRHAVMILLNNPKNTSKTGNRKVVCQTFCIGLIFINFMAVCLQSYGIIIIIKKISEFQINKDSNQLQAIEIDSQHNSKHYFLRKPSPKDEGQQGSGQSAVPKANG